ncbi:hypothetical protein [Heterosigma akashiwo virus 01]|uniref:Uncharacterized protein n=1 Tax=Heterosigma akashiwo virus 01 TaxID=97195 RepID=A0A1C9C579_HAV01|nr:hypothetical protein D1R72_gp105 [Heterosigma akashiwo virus 01]AOM63436.1 hypothetical protein [Heterosigma akashiwo virus 01]
MSYSKSLVWKKSAEYNGIKYKRFPRSKEKIHQKNLKIIDLSNCSKTKMSNSELVEFILSTIPLKDIIKRTVSDTSLHSKIKKEHIALHMMNLPGSQLKRIGSKMGKELLKKHDIKKSNYKRTSKNDINGIVLFGKNYAISWVSRNTVNCNLTTKICKHKGKCKCLYKGGCGILKRCPPELKKKTL